MSIDSTQNFDVESLFDSIGPAYEPAFADSTPQLNSIKWLLEHLPAQASVLDVGCGTGRPVCSSLASAGHHVLGIDVSGAMIAAAKGNVPNAVFEKVDLRKFEPTDGKKYDAVTVYFSMLASFTQEQIRERIVKFYSWLKKGGLFVFATVPVSVENKEISWMGRPIVTSSLGFDEVLESMKTAGFEVLSTERAMFMPKAVEAGICKRDEVWKEDHLYVYAKK